MPYPDWFGVAAVLCFETVGSDEGYNLFDRWSSTGRKYKSPRDTAQVWKRLRPDHPNPLRIATLRRMLGAEGHDWLDICSDAEDGFSPTDGEGAL